MCIHSQNLHNLSANVPRSRTGRNARFRRPRLLPDRKGVHGLTGLPEGEAVMLTLPPSFRCAPAPPQIVS
jgi:hypothetical protein